MTAQTQTHGSPETSTARENFLKLREVADLPPGGETLLKDEVIMLAETANVEFNSEWPKDRIIYAVFMHFQKDYRTRDWEEAKTGARSYMYITSDEAAWLADEL